MGHPAKIGVLRQEVQPRLLERGVNSLLGCQACAKKVDGGSTITARTSAKGLTGKRKPKGAWYETRAKSKSTITDRGLRGRNVKKLKGFGKNGNGSHLYNKKQLEDIQGQTGKGGHTKKGKLSQVIWDLRDSRRRIQRGNRISYASKGHGVLEIALKEKGKVMFIRKRSFSSVVGNPPIKTLKGQRFQLNKRVF